MPRTPALSLASRSSATPIPGPEEPAPPPDVADADVAMAEVAAETSGVAPWQLAWPVALSLAVMGVIGWATYEPGAFALMGRTIRPGLLALAVATLALQFCVGAFRLRYVSHGRITFRNGLRGQLTWDFLSALVPAAVGGGPFAAVLIASENRISVGRTTAMMLFLMLMDQVWFILLIPAILVSTAFVDVFPPALGPVGAGTMTTYLLGMMAWSTFFAYATLIRPELIQRAVGALFRLRWLRRFERRARLELERMSGQARELRERPVGFFVGGVALSAAMWTCRYLVLLFIAWSVTPGLHVVEFLFRAAALWLSAMVLPTPGGSGGMEALYLLFLEPSLPRGFAGPTLLTWRFLTYYLVIGVGSAVIGRSVHRFVRHGGGPLPEDA